MTNDLNGLYAFMEARRKERVEIYSRAWAIRRQAPARCAVRDEAAAPTFVETASRTSVVARQGFGGAA